MSRPEISDEQFQTICGNAGNAFSKAWWIEKISVSRASRSSGDVLIDQGNYAYYEETRFGRFTLGQKHLMDLGTKDPCSRSIALWQRPRRRVLLKLCQVLLILCSNFPVVCLV